MSLIYKNISYNELRKKNTKKHKSIVPVSLLLSSLTESKTEPTLTGIMPPLPEPETYEFESWSRVGSLAVLASDWLFTLVPPIYEPASLLTQLLTMTTTHKFPSLAPPGQVRLSPKTLYTMYTATLTGKCPLEMFFILP